jgi:hypothetical protein
MQEKKVLLKWRLNQRMFANVYFLLLAGLAYLPLVNAQETSSFDKRQSHSELNSQLDHHYESSAQSVSFIELYTSQGCSSCPPAERWISNFRHDKNLWKSTFPLAFHVDYWDYIGWKDEFAKPQYGTRQRLYQRLGLIRQVATPGFVVSGKNWNGWFRGQSVPLTQTLATKGELKLKVKGQAISVNYLSEDISAQDVSLKINIALLGFDMNSDIQAGENRGRNLQQDFVVLSLHHEFLLNKLEPSNQQELWTSRARLPASVNDSGVKMALVSWVSVGNDPRPIQVAGGWL